MFQPIHIENFLKKHPETNVISHPECSFEVCQRSEFVGSTEYILETVRNAEPGSRWLVGTELNLVDRLAKEVEAKGINVHFMSPTICMCSTMFRIDPQHLCWVLENLVAGQVVNQIKVEEQTAGFARLALNNMLGVQ